MIKKLGRPPLQKKKVPLCVSVDEEIAEWVKNPQTTLNSSASSFINDVLLELKRKTEELNHD